MANEASLDGVNWLITEREGKSVPHRAHQGWNHQDPGPGGLNTIAARVKRRYPKDEDGLAFKLARPGMIGDFIGGAVRRFLGGIMLLAGIVLLAACANLGGLFAARTADRPAR